MKEISQNSKPKRIFAGLLAVWMSGIAFLLCCCAMPAKAQVGGAECCPSAKKSHHCDKSMGDESPVDDHALRFSVSQADNLCLDCCGSLVLVFDKAKRADDIKHPAKLSATAKSATNPLFSLFVKTASAPFDRYRSHPLNRSGTYLRNRVFRI